MAPRVSKCPAFVRGKRYRVTREDSCGRFVYGDYAVAVVDSIITAEFTENTTEVDEINVTNSDGQRVIYEPSITEFASYTVNLTFAKLDFETFTLITGQSLYLGYDGEPIGFTVDSQVDLEDHGFGLEIWAGVSGADACADEAGTKYGYILAPFLKGGIMGGFTIENGAISFTITGATTRDGVQWGVGPYDVLMDTTQDPAVAAPLPTALGSTIHLLPIETTLAPPEAYCGTRPLLDPDATPLVSIAGAAEDSGNPLLAEFETTPTLVDEGVWYDYGDGAWEYIVGNGDASHEYEAAGTYTVSASTNGTWVTTTITVPAP